MINATTTIATTKAQQILYKYSTWNFRYYFGIIFAVRTSALRTPTHTYMEFMQYTHTHTYTPVHLRGLLVLLLVYK